MIERVKPGVRKTLTPLARSLGVLFMLATPAADAAERPNILWLVCEDSGVDWFGCYGNPRVKTPNIDTLAREGFRYTHAYASAPVCAPSRSTWITGINAVSTGTQPMRSRYLIPHGQIKYYPDYLRKAGYYTANHSNDEFYGDASSIAAQGTVTYQYSDAQVRERRTHTFELRYSVRD